MKFAPFIEGLLIFQKYFNDPDKHHFYLESDYCGVYETDKPITQEDLSRLDELRWHQPNKWKHVEYNQSEGWALNDRIHYEED